MGYSETRGRAVSSSWEIREGSLELSSEGRMEVDFTLDSPSARGLAPDTAVGEVNLRNDLLHMPMSPKTKLW